MNTTKFFSIFFLIILLTNSFTKVYTSEPIVYIDLDKLMKSSLVGKSMFKKLKIYKEDNKNRFNKNLDNLKSKEKKIISQKNVIELDEFRIKMKDLNIEFNEYKKNVNEFNNNINKLKIESEQSIMKILTPILSEFSKNNSISMILNKQNLIIAKTELDITDLIITELNKEIKEIKLKN